MELFVILPAQNRGWAQGRAAALRAIPFPRDEKGMVKSKDNRVSQVGKRAVYSVPLPRRLQLNFSPCPAGQLGDLLPQEGPSVPCERPGPALETPPTAQETRDTHSLASLGGFSELAGLGVGSSEGRVSLHSSPGVCPEMEKLRERW